MRSGKNPAGEPFALSNQSEEQVLSLDGNATELAGLITGEEEHPSRPFGVPFEHPGYLAKKQRGYGSRHATTTVYGMPPTRPNAYLDKYLPYNGFSPYL